ncbi:MAG: AI-2E family transporter [Candidatus Paceibacterota bacterium]
METSKTEKYFLFILLAIILVLTLAILYPFLSIFILAAAFAVVLDPIYLWIKKRITKNHSGIASLFTIIIFLLVLCIPLFFVGSVVFDQAQNAYQSVTANGNTDLFIQKINTSINNIMPNGFTFDTYGKIESFTSFLASNIGNFFTYTFNTIIMLVLMFFAMFYILKDGTGWKDGLVKFLPLSEKNIHQILADLKNSVNRVVKGSFFIAIIQGLLSWLGLWFFGVPNPALWGVIAGMASLIPNFGTSIVSVPAILFLYFTGLPLHALGLLIWSFLLVGTIDNILTPYIISKNTEITPILTLFAILGGISLMGPIGLLIGPLVLSLLYSLVAIYRKEIN